MLSRDSSFKLGQCTFVFDPVGQRTLYSTILLSFVQTMTFLGRNSRKQGSASAVLPESSNDRSIAQQYGGNVNTGWVAILPDSWLPYVQLARLNPPAGLCLIYFPHLFGILHAAILQQSPVSYTLEKSALMLCGSFFVSNAIHIWNDLIDAPLDCLVERTRHRPIPRGAVSQFAALVFTLTQALGAMLFLPFLCYTFFQNTLYAFPSIIGWIYYPWAKRHTYFPQFVLGFCLAWGILMGSLAMEFDLFAYAMRESSKTARAESSTICLFLASILWTMIYDTVYAHQDLQDDIKAGIKSLAVLYRDQTKPLLWQLFALMIGLLIACGRLSALAIPYHFIAVGGTAVSLGLMILQVDLKSSQSCWWWFSNGFWYAGGSIAGGLLMEYMSGRSL